jgi:hypothetical protein
MVVVRYIQSLITGNTSKIVEQGAFEEAKKSKDTKLIDVSQEVMRRRAAERSAELEGMVTVGRPNVKKKKFKGSTRQKVWDIVTRSLRISDDEMVDEITERITDVAEVDEHYQQVFENGK